jgi:hypothetical protein
MATTATAETAAANMPKMAPLLRGSSVGGAAAAALAVLLRTGGRSWNDHSADVVPTCAGSVPPTQGLAGDTTVAISAHTSSVRPVRAGGRDAQWAWSVVVRGTLGVTCMPSVRSQGDGTPGPPQTATCLSALLSQLLVPCTLRVAQDSLLHYMASIKFSSPGA